MRAILSIEQKQITCIQLHGTKSHFPKNPTKSTASSEFQLDSMNVLLVSRSLFPIFASPFVVQVTLATCKISPPGCMLTEDKLPKHMKPERRTLEREASKKLVCDGYLTLAWARNLAEKGSSILERHIVSYQLTKIFHSPFSWTDITNVDFISIAGFESGGATCSAILTHDLAKYLNEISDQDQYNFSPGLRDKVASLASKHGDGSVFLVVEEAGSIERCTLNRGECFYGKVSEDQEGLILVRTMDGAWPEIHEAVDFENKVLAMVRARTKTLHPYEFHAMSVCYVTDSGEIMIPLEPSISVSYGGLRVSKVIPKENVDQWGAEFQKSMDRVDTFEPNAALTELLFAIRLDSAKDEKFMRLWYLRLWQALVDFGIVFKKNSRIGPELVRMSRGPEWKELTKHRTAVAHWQTELIDYSMVGRIHEYALTVINLVAAPCSQVDSQ